LALKKQRNLWLGVFDKIRLIVLLDDFDYLFDDIDVFVIFAIAGTILCYKVAVNLQKFLQFPTFRHLCFRNNVLESL